MSNPHVQPGGNGGYEREDLGSKSIFAFLLGLAVFGILTFFAANGVYWALDKYRESHQPPPNPLRQTVENDTRDLDTAKVKALVNNEFPEPRLETDERNEIVESRTQEAEHLYSYGYVDQPAGVVHIPIDRAMQLLVQRGLPVRPEAETKAKP